jgi:hypothetical protein
MWDRDFDDEIEIQMMWDRDQVMWDRDFDDVIEIQVMWDRNSGDVG